MVRAYRTPRQILRERLAETFDSYEHPAKELLLAMRRAKLRHGTTLEEILGCWIAEREPAGMRGIPLPDIDLKTAATFNRLREERDALPVGPGPSALLRNTLWFALHVMAVQSVDPLWRGMRFVDITLPNLINREFVSNRQEGYFYAALFDARSNPSLLIASADEHLMPGLMHKEPSIDEDIDCASSILGCHRT